MSFKKTLASLTLAGSVVIGGKALAQETQLSESLFDDIPDVELRYCEIIDEEGPSYQCAGKNNVMYRFTEKGDTTTVSVSYHNSCEPDPTCTALVGYSLTVGGNNNPEVTLVDTLAASMIERRCYDLPDINTVAVKYFHAETKDLLKIAGGWLGALCSDIEQAEVDSSRQWICACDEMKQHKYCHCLLFVTPEGKPITEYLPEDHEGREIYGLVKDPTPDKGREARS